jgi:hypothetical protein
MTKQDESHRQARARARVAVKSHAEQIQLVGPGLVHPEEDPALECALISIALSLDAIAEALECIAPALEDIKKRLPLA